jgi:hypothetical protein
MQRGRNVVVNDLLVRAVHDPNQRRTTITSAVLIQGWYLRQIRLRIRRRDAEQVVQLRGELGKASWIG